PGNAGTRLLRGEGCSLSTHPCMSSAISLSGFIFRLTLKGLIQHGPRAIRDGHPFDDGPRAMLDQSIGIGGSDDSFRHIAGRGKIRDTTLRVMSIRSQNVDCGAI